MASFGSTINPSLGRTDYSAYLQGAQQGAQGVLAGGQAIGQGIQNAGAAIGDAIKQYHQNKVMTDTAMGKVLGALADNKRIQDVIYQGDAPPGVKKALEAVSKGKNPSLEQAALLSNYVDTIQTGLQRQDQMDFKTSELDMAQRGLQLQQNEFNAKVRGGMYERPTNQEAFNAGKEKVAAAVAAWKSQNPGMEMPATVYDQIVRAALSTAGTNVNVMPGPNAYDKTLGEEAAKLHLQQYKEASDMPVQLAKLDELTNLVKNGDVNTGPLADLKTKWDQAQNTILGLKQAGKRVSDTQVMEAMMNSGAFEQMQALGLGSRNMDTPAEREFLIKSMTGEKGMQKETLLRMTEARRKAILSKSEQYKKNNDAGVYKRLYEEHGFPALDFSYMSSAGGSTDGEKSAIEKKYGIQF
jgi:hypothetical protein